MSRDISISDPPSFKPKFVVIIRFPLEHMVTVALEVYETWGAPSFGVSRNTLEEGMLQIWDIDNTDHQALAVYLFSVFKALNMEQRYLIQLAENKPIQSGEGVNFIIDTTTLVRILTSTSNPKRYVVAVLYDTLSPQLT